MSRASAADQAAFGEAAGLAMGGREHPSGARMTAEGRKYLSYPSVTTVLSVLSKPGLPWGAAKETALFAVHHQDEWQHLSPDDAVDRLRKHHKGVWTDKATRGTVVHELAKEWAKGNPVDVEVEHVGYLDALERFYADWEPTWIEVERTVLYQDSNVGYGGTLDAVAYLIDGRSWLLDIKTGADVWPEVALQLAAYRYAPELALFDAAGRELIGTNPMPEVDRCGVVHLAGDGTYRLVPVEAEAAEFDAFMAARALWQWTSTQAKSVLGEPARPKGVDS